MFDGSPFQSVSEIKYLGVLLDSSPSFRRHIDCITLRAYETLSTLYKSQTHLPLATRKMLYRSLVLPHLEYCPSVWDPTSKQLSDQVEPVQNRAMQTILGKPSGTRSLPLRSELGSRTLSDRRKLRQAITFKIMNKIALKYLHNILIPNTNTKGRHKDNLYVVQPNTNWLKNSFTYRSTLLWNSLDSSTRQANSYSSFVCRFCSNLTQSTEHIYKLTYRSYLFFLFVLLFSGPSGRPAFADETHLVK